MTSRSHVQTAIFADDSVAVFNERTQRMLSLNRTAAYLWFRQAEVDHAELATHLAARTGIELSDARRTIDEHIATWKAAGFMPSDEGDDVAVPPNLATIAPRVTDEHMRRTEQITQAPRSAASLSGRLSGLNFCIRYEPQTLRHLLEPALQHLLGSAGSPDLAIDLQRDELGWTVLNGVRAFASGLRTNEVVPVVIYALLDGLLRRSGNSIAFHASAVRTNGRCVLLAAPPGSGKSTLCAALLGQGYEFIADDVVLFDGMNRRLRGVPLPVSLKAGSWAPLLNAYPQLEAATVHVRQDGKSVKFLVPPGIAAAAESHSVTAVIFPRFISGTDVELRRVDQSLALNRLVSEASTPSLRLSGDSFADLASFLRQTSCWELRLSALPPAVDAIDQICQSSAPPE